MRIAIYGTGGAGGYFGARLIEGGHEVVLIARGAHLDAIRARGLVLETPQDTRILVPALATDDPARAGPVDVVILGVKTWQVDESARAMLPLIGPETIVVPLQNGVEAAAQLVAALGGRHVLGGLCVTFSRVTAPGHIRSDGVLHYLRFGALDNRPDPRAELLRGALEQAGVRAEIPADIQVALWEKFLFVVSAGGVGAVTRAPMGVTRAMPETRDLLERAMGEVLAVARARGIGIADGAVARGMQLVDGMPPNGTSSLQRDIAAGKPSELEAWSGAVVRLGREVGVPTPVHEFVYFALLPQERSARSGA